MKLKSLFLSSLPILVITITSCSNDDETPLIIPTPKVFNYTVPETYTFERESATTVDHSGQTYRLIMLDEMGAYIRNAGVNGTVADDAYLSDMFTNTNNRFAGAGLNTSGKQLKDKTAASKDYFSLYYGGGTTLEQTNVRIFFESTFDDAEAASQGAAASPGVAGVYLDGSSKRLYAANGLEPQQVFLKGMMGACLMDQIVNNYLSKHKLDEGSNRTNNTKKVLEVGKPYTAMEHAWDEAYGYIYGNDNLTVTPNTFKYWSSYINQVNADSDFNTLKNDINLAFRKGRAAIVANDYETRNKQINIIKAKLAMVPAVRAVFYLQEGKTKLAQGDGGIKAFHALSEAYGFIMSLRYTNKPGTDNPYFSKSEVDSMLASMISGPNGLWDIDQIGPKLDAISNQIATKFGFTVAQAATVN
ncbi:DUF4856 domain-containing protein [Flavobacterium amnicola]|uniref:DUF4856 domain-containing protein n=1 Tax=Flavobacterium amnicola TaxID=2506422 RepID=A0A4Q1K0I7_9FLAO|nr:DUF4856 domain-containing protein [Flavobacterium amnicola]RXR17236.1 DUF4856 domain-containing protein [Flavobacterium amnicola]